MDLGPILTTVSVRPSLYCHLVQKEVASMFQELGQDEKNKFDSLTVEMRRSATGRNVGFHTSKGGGKMHANQWHVLMSKDSNKGTS